MAFDVQRLFEDYQIQHWTEGKNVAHGFVNVQCPHCDDRSNHGGFSENGTVYLCWRCGRHRVDETMALVLQVERSHIYSILNKYKTYIGSIEEEYESYVGSVQVPGTKLGKGHKRYLESRGFDPVYLENKYGLTGTLARADRLAYRIIVPVYKNGQIISYQGRDFTDQQEQKYINCKRELEVYPIKWFLYNLDNCNLNKVLVFEGAFDVFRFGNNTVATLGVGYTSQQLAILATRFEEIYVMFDSDDAGQGRAKNLTDALAVVGKKVHNIVLDKGDPADQTEAVVREIKQDLKI